MNTLDTLAHTLELAVTPVFLLAGIGALLNVVTSRLGRVIDRARILEKMVIESPDTEGLHDLRSELGALDRRMSYAQLSIAFSTVAALFVCLVVALLFIGSLLGAKIIALVVLFFVGSMTTLTIGLSLFLAEVYIATRTMRVRAELFIDQP